LKKAWKEKRLRKLRCTIFPYKTEPLNHCHLCNYTISNRDALIQGEERQEEAE
jgi:hypothetical protein